MYSWEIDNLMKLRNYLLTTKEYLSLYEGSTQFNRITYNPYENVFYISTNDGYEWLFKVRSEEDETRVY